MITLLVACMLAYFILKNIHNLLGCIMAIIGYVAVSIIMWIVLTLAMWIF